MSINIESGFSFNGSLVQKSNLINVKEKGYKALGLVDDNTAFFLTFYYEMKAMDIKPILGLRCYGKYFDYILYPMNYSGYKEILYYASSKDRKDIVEVGNLLISSNILYVLDITRCAIDNTDFISSDYKYLKDQNQDTYLGVDFSYYPCEVGLYPIFNNKDYKIIITDKVKYFNEEDRLSSDILEAIIKGTELKENNIFDIEDNINYSLLSAQDFRKQYKDYPELLRNTIDFIHKINIEITFDKTLPKYPTKNNVPSDIYLRKLAEKGLSKRLLGTNKDPILYKKRLDYELDIIHKMGFDDYFLVVYDYILYAKKNGIMVGPGRGSAASSLVSYSIGIVDVDPIEYNLFFERFLNPSRKTMPDIDTDFENTRRDDVIKYVSDKYGETHVSLISTSQTFGVKSSLREVSKLLETPLEKLNLLLKEASSYKDSTDDDDNPDDPGSDSSQEKLSFNLFMRNKNVRSYYELDEDIKKLIDVSIKLEGLPRSVGIHAAGVIIAGSDLRDYSEIHHGQKKFIQTTYDANSLYYTGLLKMDFLSLKNLTIIHDILDDIKKNKGVDVKISKINLNDKATYNLLNTKSTIGIFQLESPGMEKTLKDMKVSNFNDLCICIALYRPGPMDQIPTFIKRRNGEQRIDYYDESIKDILVDTLGVIVYQEQTMSIVSKYAGLSLSDADTVRRAMSKKDESLMNEVKAKFFDGASKMNRDPKTTKRLFDDILKFADYGYNKAHTVSYAMITFTLAYLKTHYPNEFMVNLLKNSSTNKSYIKECASLGLTILPPDARYSSSNYKIQDGVIYMPFSQIKGIGKQLSNDIERISHEGDYSFESFVKNSKDIFQRGLIEELILSGIFDYTGYNKRTMIEALDGLYEFDLSVISGMGEYKVQKKEEYPFDYLKAQEAELLGFNPKYHPIKSYKGNLPKLSDVSEETTQFVNLAVYVSEYKEIKTKSGEFMASLTIEDEFKYMSAVIFPSDFLKCEHFLKKDRIYEVKGSFRKDNKNKSQLVIKYVKEV